MPLVTLLRVSVVRINTLCCGCYGLVTVVAADCIR